MKPAAFEYSRPATLDEACALLAADDGARLIAGGQTLVPLMAMRLARPTRLIDIARIPGLAYIRDEGDEIVDRRDDQAMRGRRRSADPRQAAAARQGDAARRPHADAGERHDRRLARQRRSGGGDRAGCGDARRHDRLARGGKASEAHVSEFIVGPMVTSLPQAACLTEARFPVWKEQRIGVGFHEVNARSSDFAFVSAAAQIALDADGRCARIALGIGAATAFPIRIDADALVGSRVEEQRVLEVVDAALANVETMDDLHASAAYRKRAARTLAVRAVTDAYKDAHRAEHARRA